LRQDVQYPFFLKPARSKHGVGAVGVTGFAWEEQQLVLVDGHRVDLGDYLRDVDARLRVDRFGVLLQEYLAPDSRLVPVCGERLSSIRLIVLLCQDGPQPLHAVWKIPVGKNMTDNFHHGVSGNLLGYVNLNTGRVERVIGGAAGGQVEALFHPDTGVALLGITLPDWSRLIGVGVEGARALPALRWQSWDIAMSSGGPMILEMNAFADVDLVQYAYGAGLNDTVLRAYLARIAE
jgi:hypothetical protein